MWKHKGAQEEVQATTGDAAGAEAHEGAAAEATGRCRCGSAHTASTEAAEAPSPAATAENDTAEADGRPGAMAAAAPLRANAPLYRGRPLEYWLMQDIKGPPETTIIMLRSLAEVDDPAFVRRAFEQCKQRTDREVSPQGLASQLAVLCALGVGESSDEAAAVTFQVLRRQRLSPLAPHMRARGGSPPPELVPSLRGESLASAARAGLATLPRPVVLRHIAEELEHGSSFSRHVVLAAPQEIHNWTEDLTPFSQGLVAASRDENTVVASEAIRLLAGLAAVDESVRQRLNEAFDEPRLRGAAAASLFQATVQPGTIEQAVEMARADDPRTAVIGIFGLIGQSSEPSLRALLELLVDESWSATRPQQEGPMQDGPWPRLEAIRGLEQYDLQKAGL